MSTQQLYQILVFLETNMCVWGGGGYNSVFLTRDRFTEFGQAKFAYGGSI